MSAAVASSSSLEPDQSSNRRMAAKEESEDVSMDNSDGDADQSDDCSPMALRSAGSGAAAAARKKKAAQSHRQRVVAGFSFYSSLSLRKPPAVPRLEGAFEKDSAKQLGEAWAKFFHANGIPAEKADCPHFREAMRLTQQLGDSVQRIPTGSEIDGPYLQSEYDELEEYVAGLKRNWELHGVSVLCDSWTGPSGTSIVNFMIACDGRLFFHKSVDATGHIHSAQYLYQHIREVVVEDIGQGFVVQIVTENGSNFKEACEQLIKEYPRIVWQPCAAHTVNLMLEDIGNIPKVNAVVSSAKRICRFFYNHSELHDQMKTKIGGELIQPNAARFGTDFMFLQSFWDNKHKLRQWVVLNEGSDSSWSREPDYYYTYDSFVSSSWWEDVKWVLYITRPLYAVLRHADSQKTRTLSGFMPRMTAARDELQSLFQVESEDWKNVMDVVDKKVADIYKDNLMIAAGVLDPEAHYKYDLASNPDYMQAFKMTIQKVADTPANAAEALDQFEFFRSSRGRFDTGLARSRAGKRSPSLWWLMFGGEIRILQGYAIRILSQCMSSSGCERNWSTFALMHAEAKNRLANEKLHKLVYVRYNLKLRTEETKIHTEEMDGEEEKELDPCRMMMAVTLYDKENPVMDWLNMPDSVSLTPQDEATPCRALVDMMHTETSCEDALNKPIGASGSKGKDMLDGTKRKRKKSKISANDDGSLHAMSTRNKTKGLPGLG